MGGFLKGRNAAFQTVNRSTLRRMYFTSNEPLRDIAPIMPLPSHVFLCMHKLHTNASWLQLNARWNALKCTEIRLEMQAGKNTDKSR